MHKRDRGNTETHTEREMMTLHNTSTKHYQTCQLCNLDVHKQRVLTSHRYIEYTYNRLHEHWCEVRKHKAMSARQVRRFCLLKRPVKATSLRAMRITSRICVAMLFVTLAPNLHFVAFIHSAGDYKEKLTEEIPFVFPCRQLGRTMTHL